MPGNASQHVVSIVNGTKLRGLYYSGTAELLATAANGATLRLTASAYQRSTSCAFRESEYSVYTGGRVQVDFITNTSGSNKTLEPSDVTFTLTGDTDCVIADTAFSYYTFTGLQEGAVTLTARLYNGYTTSTVIHVTVPEGCKNGHDPVWAVTAESTAIRQGVRTLRCSRCGVPLGQEEAVPCTGVQTFEEADVYITDSGDTRSTILKAMLNGSRMQSFTYRSSAILPWRRCWAIS